MHQSFLKFLLRSGQEKVHDCPDMLGMEGKCKVQVSYRKAEEVSFFVRNEVFAISMSVCISVMHSWIATSVRMAKSFSVTCVS